MLALVTGILMFTAEAQHGTLAATLTALLESAGASVVHVQRGRALLNAAGFGIEHFGYVDGRSQPLMLVEDIDKEAARTIADSIVADGAQSLIREQVEMGVAVRMAVLEALSRNLPNA